MGPYESRARVTEEFIRVQRSTPEGYSVVEPTSPVPLWVGGNSAAAQRRAALLGDGWHPLWMPDGTYAEARRRILDIRKAAGLTEAFTFSYSCSATQVLLELPQGWTPPRARAPVGSEFRYAPEMWVDEDNRPRFVGTPDQVIGDLRLLEVAGVEHVTLRFASTEVRDLERFVKEIRPAFA